MARTELKAGPGVLRPWRAADADALAREANDRRIWVNMRDAFPHPCRLYAMPFASKPASARVLQKAGYRLEATLRENVVKDGKVLDQWMYALLRRELGGERLEAGGGPR